MQKQPKFYFELIAWNNIIDFEQELFSYREFYEEWKFIDFLNVCFNVCSKDNLETIQIIIKFNHLLLRVLTYVVDVEILDLSAFALPI